MTVLLFIGVLQCLAVTAERRCTGNRRATVGTTKDRFL